MVKFRALLSLLDKLRMCLHICQRAWLLKADERENASMSFKLICCVLTLVKAMEKYS
jgi:hypothetical protein